MTSEEHREIVASEAEGRLLVGIDRASARQFFTQTDGSSMATITGEHLYAQIILVKTAVVLANLLPFVAAGLAVAAFGWWALLIGPATIVLCLFFFNTSRIGGVGLGFPASIFVAAAVSFFAAPLPAFARWWLLALAAAIFFARFMYVAATVFLRHLVLTEPPRI
jgi:hypothetical protein